MTIIREVLITGIIIAGILKGTLSFEVGIILLICLAGIDFLYYAFQNVIAVINNSYYIDYEDDENGESEDDEGKE